MTSADAGTAGDPNNNDVGAPEAPKDMKSPAKNGGSSDSGEDVKASPTKQASQPRHSPRDKSKTASKAPNLAQLNIIPAAHHAAPLSPLTPGYNMHVGGAEQPGTYEVIPHRIFVGGFSPEVMEKDLRELFEKFAQVREVKVIRNTDTGISKGYGFVTFETDEEARAVRTSNEKLEIEGHRLNIGPAMRRIHHNTRNSDLSSPLFAPAAYALGPGGTMVPLLLQQMPVDGSGHVPGATGWFGQHVIGPNGVPYMVAMPTQAAQFQQAPHLTTVNGMAGQTALSYMTPSSPTAAMNQAAFAFNGQLAQYNAAGSFAYSPTGTPMLAAHQAPAAGQMQSYGHAGFNSNSSARQEQQQSYASAVSRNDGSGTITQTPTTRLTVGGGGGSTGARGLGKRNQRAQENGNKFSGNSGTWSASVANDNSRWQQMSASAAAGAVDHQSGVGTYAGASQQQQQQQVPVPLMAQPMTAANSAGYGLYGDAYGQQLQQQQQSVYCDYNQYASNYGQYATSGAGQ